MTADSYLWGALLLVAGWILKDLFGGLLWRFVDHDRRGPDGVSKDTHAACQTGTASALQAIHARVDRVEAALLENRRENREGHQEIFRALRDLSRNLNGHRSPHEAEP